MLRGYPDDGKRLANMIAWPADEISKILLGVLNESKDFFSIFFKCPRLYLEYRVSNYRYGSDGVSKEISIILGEVDDSANILTSDVATKEMTTASKGGKFQNPGDDENPTQLEI